MPLDIRPDHLKIVEKILEKHVPDREVWAFGSRVNGTAKGTSDLDLAVIGENPLDFQTLGALRDAFSESNLPYKVDVVDWATISDTFREIIRKDNVVIKKRISNGQEIEGFVDNWQELSFSQAVLLNPGTHLVRGKVYPFVDMAAVSSDSHCVYSAEYRFFRGNGSKFVAGDTLMARITPCLENGKIARFCAEHGVVAHGSTEFIVIRGREDFTENDYAYYLIKWEKVRSYAISQMTGTSGRQRVQTKVFDHLFVPIPPLPEQRAIAHILGTLDDKIELNRRMNETLEAMAQAIFKSWFVDFDPVRAKMEGRPTGLTKEIEDLFPDSFEDSELGEIPRGWEVATIGEIVNIAGGSTPSTKESTYWENGCHYWATPKDLSSLSTPVLLGTERKITDAGLAQIGSGKLPAGTVLLSSRAPIGYLAISEVPVSINQGFIAMLPREEVSNLFILYWAACAHEEIVSRANGSTFLEISKANFRQILVIRPTKSVMELFESNVRPLYLQIVRNERETMILATLRSSLLPKLLSGEIRVKEA